MAFVPKTGDIIDGSTYIGYRDPATGYFSGAPLATPVTPALTGDNDRPIGNDYVGSDIQLTSPPVMHKVDFDVSFYVNTTSKENLKCIYGEGQTTNKNFLNMIATNTSGQIWLFARQSDGVLIFPDYPQGSIDVCDGQNHLVRVYRSGASIYVVVDGVEEELVNYLSGELEVGHTSTIGACKTTLIEYDFTGKIWDVNKNGTIIPINEGTGTDIKDSSGASIGTLTDPSVTYWDYSVGTWTLVSDEQCDDNNLITVDQIAITDENGFAREV